MFYSILQGCTNKGDLAAGREAYHLIVKSGYQSNAFLGSHLIRMFALCGSLLEANHIFSRLPAPDVFTWTAIISANAKFGQYDQAFKLYHQMQQSSISLDGHIFAAVLKACKSAEALKQAKMIHACIIENCLETDAFLGNVLIDMYAKCGSLDDARMAFHKLSERDLVTWGAIIAAHVDHGHGEEAVRLFKQMEQEGTEPDRIIILTVLKACSSIGALNEGRLIHTDIIDRGLESELSVTNTLIYMYAKCGSFEDARRVFDKFPKHDLVTWNAMISGCALLGHGHDALQLFRKMLQEGMLPNQVTLLSILKCCATIMALHQGELIYGNIIESGCESNVSFGNTIIDMYAKCGSLANAQSVFYTLSSRSVVSWNAIIAGHVQHEHGHEALEFFRQMLQEGIGPNEITFVSILKAFSSEKVLCQGKLIHCHIIESHFECYVSVAITLIDMYANCGGFKHALWVFHRLPKRDVITWNAIIAAYATHGHGQKALQLFQHMQQEGMEPNQVTFNCVLKACSSAAALQPGKLIHGYVVKDGSDLNPFVQNTIIDLYTKCRRVEEAHWVFDKLPKQDVVTWNVIIAGYALHGSGQEALELFQQMQECGTKPNQATFVSILKACSVVAALQQGKLIHSQIIKCGYFFDTIIGNSLIDMYAKCGSLEGACSVFAALPNRDVVLWCSMITACAQHSNCKLAIQYLEDMQKGGVKPNDGIFVSLLSAFSHGGLVDEGCLQFKCMIEDYGIAPTLDHCNCMVDLLGRAGCLNIAKDFIQCTPYGSNFVGWISLLTHCKIHGDVEIAKHCFDHLLNMDHEKAAGYVLMSQVYAYASMPEDADKIEESRKYASAWKAPGMACIEINDNVHEFVVGGKHHPLTVNFQEKLKRLSLEMKEEGYMPCLDTVLQSITELYEENALWIL